MADLFFVVGKERVESDKTTDSAITTRPEGGTTFGDCVVNGVVRVPFSGKEDECETEWQEGWE